TGEGTMRFLLHLVVTAVAFWVATRLVSGLSYVGPLPGLLLVALLFGVVNAVLGGLLRILSLPVTFLTLGLFALVINAVLLWVTGAVAGSLGLGLHVDGFLPAFLGAVVIGITRAVLNTVVDRRGRR
ncbi:MAG: phage holin family protein, partial [Myxococcaceae bacterium]